MTRLRVLFLPLDPDGPEERAAWAWLERSGLAARRIGAGDTALEADVVWIHAGHPVGDPGPALLSTLREALDASRLLLSGGAATLPARMGLEPVPPGDATRAVWSPETDELHRFQVFAATPRIRGHASFRSHPLFHDLDGAAFTWAPTEAEEFTTVTYRRPVWPARARVLAVERSFIHIEPDRATIWEYDRVLCIGAYCYFAAPNPRHRPHLERLAENALRYAAGRLEAGVPAGIWRHRPAGTAHDPSLALPPAPARAHALPPLEGTIRLAGEAGDDRPFTLAGRRTLVAGGEARGVDEVWVHPLRVVRELRLAGARARDVVVTPVGVTRVIESGGRLVTEKVFVPRGLAAGVVEWTCGATGGRDGGGETGGRDGGRATGERDGGGETGGRDGGRATGERDGGGETGGSGGAVRLEVSWHTDMRLMWPYPENALGPLRWTASETSVLVHADEAGDAALFRFSRAPQALEVLDASTDRASALEIRASFRLESGSSLQLAIAGTTEGGDDLARTAATLEDLRPLVGARAAAARRLRADTLWVSAPDPRAAEALEWAAARLDSYVVETPGVGRSLIAGYWTSRPGWNDGRPGYAWYFGRDAVWTALAGLAAGQFEAAADVLRFLGRHQDLTGKILHECTTSGVVHYDAADSTPLYLLLAARYAAWTGDLGLLAEQWERVRRAYDFCLSTDTDGDGLIENTGVGHGWIEFGRLGGGTVTIYNAAIWAAALRELADAAESLGDARFAAEARQRSEHARRALEEAFYDPQRRAYALNLHRAHGPGGKLAQPAMDSPRRAPQLGFGGVWTRTPIQTAMQAVPLLLGVTDPARAASWLDAIASDDFTAPWGVRMVPLSDPEYDPQSYHGGAVWPLFTGWASWAEFAAGRSEAGFRHWWSNVEQGCRRARGSWDEVLHGTEERSAGVCPDQAWSAAMVVSPLVYGLLGAEADAPRRRLRLRPQIPAVWERLEVKRLRVGDCAVAFRYERQGARHVFRVEQEAGGAPLTLILEPALPIRRLRAASVDGRPASLDTRAFGERSLVSVQIVLDHERTIVMEGDGGGAPGLLQ